MPPAGGHYGPNNLSNPYNQYTPHSQYQTPNNNYNAQAFSNHGNFGGGQTGQQMNIFGGSAVQNGPQSAVFGAGTLQSGGGTGLASQEAQIRFAHGAAMQRQQDVVSASRSAGSVRIREVYKDNLNHEFSLIRALVDKYPFVSMDTEFPGIVARPIGQFTTKADYHYQTLRCNVDLLKIIQLGITLWSPEGELPPSNLPAHLETPQHHKMKGALCPCTWTFNFKFSVEEDMSSSDSISMLRKSGVDFEKCLSNGIEPRDFGARLIDSGLVLDNNITWLSFHSGYDFGYLVKLMSPTPMPDNDERYLDSIKTWFRNIYDIKYLLRVAQTKARNEQLSEQATLVLASLGSKSGLQDLADELHCEREGKPHTAGSDAWLTGSVFWSLRKLMFDNEVPDEYLNKIWGLSGVGPPASAASQAAALASQTPNSNGATLFHSGMTPSTYISETPRTPQDTHTGLSSASNSHRQGYQGGMGMGGGQAFNFLLQSPPPTPCPNPSIFAYATRSDGAAQQHYPDQYDAQNDGTPSRPKQSRNPYRTHFARWPDVVAQDFSRGQPTDARNTRSGWNSGHSAPATIWSPIPTASEDRPWPAVHAHTLWQRKPRQTNGHVPNGDVQPASVISAAVPMSRQSSRSLWETSGFEALTAVLDAPEGGKEIPGPEHDSTASIQRIKGYSGKSGKGKKSRKTAPQVDHEETGEGGHRNAAKDGIESVVDHGLSTVASVPLETLDNAVLCHVNTTTSSNSVSTTAEIIAIIVTPPSDDGTDHEEPKTSPTTHSLSDHLLKVPPDPVTAKQMDTLPPVRVPDKESQPSPAAEYKSLAGTIPEPPPPSPPSTPRLVVTDYSVDFPEALSQRRLTRRERQRRMGSGSGSLM